VNDSHGAFWFEYISLGHNMESQFWVCTDSYSNELCWRDFTQDMVQPSPADFSIALVKRKPKMNVVDVIFIFWTAYTRLFVYFWLRRYLTSSVEVGLGISRYENQISTLLLSSYAIMVLTSNLEKCACVTGRTSRAMG
jgi:hypothetical protein